MPRKKWPLRFVLASVAIIIVALGIQWLRVERFWPFATGGSERAFLGATFGMSPQEVRRAIALDGARLLPYDEYRRTEPLASIEVYGPPVLSETAVRETALYMPSIEMFDARVEGEFTFSDDKLRWVAVYFQSLKSSPASLVSALEKRLRSDYRYVGREDSSQVPGAYTLNFDSPATSCSLWVNLAGNRPLIILNLGSEQIAAMRRREIAARERRALGSAR
jgi:hypothetical protein